MQIDGVEITSERLGRFCEQNRIRKLSLFGSVLTPSFGPNSDIDILIEFDREHVPGLLRLTEMEEELSKMLGRKVDLRTPGEISRYFRDEVLASAAVQYERG